MPEPASLFSKVEFLVSAGVTGGLPPEGLPELAFAGRSNVGKSSAINALARRKRLAFVSKTPGRTQTINFFDLGGHARLVDLPGYGYLGARRSLAGVVVLMDARHPFTAHDEYLLEWLRPVAQRLLVLLSKADKLSRQERTKVLAEARARLVSGAHNVEVRLFSSVSGEGVEEARTLLEAWLRAAGDGHKKPPVKGNSTGGETP
jgi:GTP-binding protein